MKPIDHAQPIDSIDLGPPITSRTNARVKALRAALSGKASREGDLLGLEGWNLLRETVGSGQTLEAVYVREGTEDKVSRYWHEHLRAREWHLLSRDVFDSAVSTETPQGIAATWIIQPVASRQSATTIVPILEDVQDPGNVGTLIRSGAAFGSSEVILTPGSAGQWNPKTLRASAGAVFHIPVRRMPLEEAVASLRTRGVRIFAAVASWTPPVLKLAPQGVLFGRQRSEGAATGNQAILPDGTSVSTVLGTEGAFASSSYDADFDGPCAILIGNEGAGLSKRALELADEHVLIPTGVESLNAAVAGSILLYEAMRQIPLRVWAQREGLRP
jgi:TrmH family RNA methyltransferase